MSIKRYPIAISDIDTKRCYAKSQIKKAVNGLTNGTDIDESIEMLLYWRAKNLFRIVNIFDAFSSSVKVTSEHIREASIDGYILISIQRTGTIFEIQSSIYRRLDFQKASSDYLELEKKAIGKDSDLIVAMVPTNALGGIQEAYPNYFADARVFLELLMIASVVYKKIYSPVTRLVHKVKNIFGSF